MATEELFQKMLEAAIDLRTLGYNFKEAVPILKENFPDVKKMTSQQLKELKQAFRKDEDAEFFAQHTFL